jgi:hypothetical protein
MYGQYLLTYFTFKSTDIPLVNFIQLTSPYDERFEDRKCDVNVMNTETRDFKPGNVRV